MAKPMVTVRGETLLDRLVRIFRNNDATGISVVTRSPIDSSDTLLSIITRTTPSSMHSFYELKPYLKGIEPFILTTVDTIFREDEFCDFVRAFRDAIAEGYDGLMGVTDYIDDEKPLYVKTKAPLSSFEGDVIVSEDEVEGFYDAPCSLYVSAGIYGLIPSALDTLERCMERGESRMRNFQRALVREGRRLKAWRFSKVIDIDHASDIPKAEELLEKADAEKCDNGENTATVLYILRAEEFSPGRVEDDRAIMMAVKERVGEGPVIREEELINGSDGTMERWSEYVNTQLSHLSPFTVFSMARRPESLDILKRWEAAGARVINAPVGVERCRRSTWDAMMREHGMPVPPTTGRYGYWLKRGDLAVAGALDIAYCKDEKELAEAKRRFAERGITDVVVQAHVRGELVKFYGILSEDRENDGTSERVSEESFFRCYPDNAAMRSLAREAERMAHLVGIQVYGGDAVVAPNGDFYIIDFNDWPSFSRCREEAAEKIGKLR